MIDVSTSVDHPALCGKIGTFDKVKQFASEVVSALGEFGQLSQDKVRVSVVTFADNGNVVADFAGNGADGTAVTASIGGLAYTGAGGSFTDSNVHLGLASARSVISKAQMDDAGSARQSRSKNVIVVLSDGLARNSVGANSTAQLLTELDEGASIYDEADTWAFFTGRCPDKDTLKMVAPDHTSRLKGETSSQKLITSITSDPKFQEWCTAEAEDDATSIDAPTTAATTTTTTTTTSTTEEPTTTQVPCFQVDCAQCVDGSSTTCARCTNSKFLAAGFCLPNCKRVRGGVEFGDGIEGRECRT